MSVIKKTKIVATLGPATSSEDIIEKMILAGVNVFRVNFSHADYNDVSERIQMIRDVDKKLNTNTAILGDLQGPKLRVGKIEEGTVVNPGDRVVFSTDAPFVGNGPGAIPLTLIPYLPHSAAKDLVIALIPDLDIAEGTT